MSPSLLLTSLTLDKSTHCVRTQRFSQLQLLPMQHRHTWLNMCRLPKGSNRRGGMWRSRPSWFCCCWLSQHQLQWWRRAGASGTDRCAQDADAPLTIRCTFYVRITAPLPAGPCGVPRPCLWFAYMHCTSHTSTAALTPLLRGAVAESNAGALACLQWREIAYCWCSCSLKHAPGWGLWRWVSPGRPLHASGWQHGWPSHCWQG